MANAPSTHGPAPLSPSTTRSRNFDAHTCTEVRGTPSTRRTRSGATDDATGNCRGASSPARTGRRCPLCGPVSLRTVKARRRHVDASAPPAYDGPDTQCSRLRLLRLQKAPLTRNVDTRVDIAVDVHTGGARRWPMTTGLSSEGRALGHDAHEVEERHLGHEAPPPEADDGELAAGDELVGEGPGDPKQDGCLADAVDETFRRRASSGCVLLTITPPFRGSDRHSLPIEGQFANRFWTSSWSGATWTPPNPAEIVTIRRRRAHGHNRDAQS